MHNIELQEMTQEFFTCWQCAGQHLNKQLDGGIRFWLRTHPYPPFLEHLSFRIGNQLFFIRVEDADGIVQGPGTYKGLYSVADGSKGHACLLTMKRAGGGAGGGGLWVPARPGWGLIDARLDRPVDPPSLVTDEKIEMTRWELQDMAVQIVRDDLTKKDLKLMSWQSNPDVDPSLWFVGESGGPEWVVVRPATFPDKEAARPRNWEGIANQCARMSRIGHFASVGITSPDQKFASPNEAREPLWRGHKMHLHYDGLE